MTIHQYESTIQLYYAISQVGATKYTALPPLIYEKLAITHSFSS
jgi:hypothetical protein